MIRERNVSSALQHGAWLLQLLPDKIRHVEAQMHYEMSVSRALNAQTYVHGIFFLSEEA